MQENAGPSSQPVSTLARRAAKAIVPAAIRGAIRKVFPYRPPRMSDAERYSAYEPIRPGAFVNIGAGGFHHPYWTNIDHASAHYAGDQNHAFLEYDLNLIGPLPVPTESVDLAYTSHVIEHVSNEAVERLFSEVYRALKPGGVFRITCPDADLFYLTLRFGRSDYWTWRREKSGNRKDASIEELAVSEMAAERFSEMSPEVFRRELDSLPKEQFLDWLTAPCVFDPARPGRHINWWNFDKCLEGLKRAGFRTVWRSSYGASIACPMQDTQLFDATYPVMSFYVETMKS